MLSCRLQPRAFPLLSSLVFLCALSSTPARALPSSGPESFGNWHLALSVAGGGGVDETEIAADDEQCEFADNRLCSDENFEHGLVQLDMRVFTPQQIDLLGKPRFFLRAGILRKFGNDVAVKVEPVSDSVFIRSARAEQNGIIWDVGLGVAFPFSWRDHPLQIETSVSYGQEPLVASGRYADDDAGRFKLKTDLDLDFIKTMIEVTAPVYERGGIQLDAVLGSYLQFIISNEKSKQQRSRVVDFRYEKEIGFGAFVGVRVVFGREPAAL